MIQSLLIFSFSYSSSHTLTMDGTDWKKKDNPKDVIPEIFESHLLKTLNICNFNKITK